MDEPWRQIPRRVCEELSIAVVRGGHDPAGIAVLCAWAVDDKERVKTTRAELLKYCDDARTWEFVELMPGESHAARSWLVNAMEAMYGPK